MYFPSPLFISPLGNGTAIYPFVSFISSSFYIVPTICSFRQVLGRNGLCSFPFSRHTILKLVNTIRKNIFKEVASVDPTNSHWLWLWSFYDSQPGQPRH